MGIFASNTRVIQAVAILAFVGIAAFVVWWKLDAGEGGKLEPPPLAAQSGHESDETIATARADRLAENPAFARAGSDAAAANYEDQFETATDLAPFAEQMHAQAKQNDDAAQYWLYRVLWQCGPRYDTVFVVDPALPDKPPLSLDEALADEEANPRLGADEIRKLHAQCAQLREADPERFGNPRTWLKKSASTGYPLAQVWRASEIAVGFDTEGSRTEARELMIAAVKSGDAEVIRQTGAVAQALAQGESERERHQWVWEVAGCQRGADCGPTTSWVRSLCAEDRRCQPYETAIDLIRRRVGAQMPEIEEEARQLNARIDQKTWDQLGL